MKSLHTHFYIMLFSFFLTVLMTACSDDEPTKPDNNKINDTTSYNLDFELWHPEFNDKNDSIYEDISGGFWGTINQLKRLGGPVTTLKTTDAVSGDYAVKLETVTWGTLTITGLLITGRFDLGIYDVIQGMPFTGKPTNLRGYYKYLPAEQDSGSIYINLTKYNQSAQKKDTIAEAKLIVYSAVPDYTPFDLKLNYYDNSATPDTIKIAVVSSHGEKGFVGAAGSAMYVDGFSLVLPDSVIKIMIDKKSVRR